MKTNIDKYPSFSSIERLENIHCVITEKVDGTNGLIEINSIGIDYDAKVRSPKTFYTDRQILEVKFGSRNRYIAKEDDNAGFCNFFSNFTYNIVEAAKNMFVSYDEEGIEEERHIGFPIRIYGEWFGKGIQRNYNLDTKYFMPFNTYFADRLTKASTPNIRYPNIMYTGKFNQEVVDKCMDKLVRSGSCVVNDYPRPEGVVIHFPKYNLRLKQTFEGSKWEQALPKSKHDKKPTSSREDLGQCTGCGKRMYYNKQTNEVQCMNIRCDFSPNFKVDSDNTSWSDG